MRRILSVAMIIGIMFSLAACSGEEGPKQSEKPYTGAPMIVLDGNKYFSNSSFGISELPDGYELGGTLSNEQIKYAISVEEGAEYFIDTRRENIDDLYVYQECKVENSDEFQLAYMQYTLSD